VQSVHSSPRNCFLAMRRKRKCYLRFEDSRGVVMSCHGWVRVLVQLLEGCTTSGV
jgi:hypothetical protein